MSNSIFKANLILRGKIECLTGLHIGGSKEKLEIGGVDAIVVRSPRTDFPYIPGSSLKGKLRHLLEYITGAVNEPLDDVLGNVSKAEEIVRVFGIGADERSKDEDKDGKENPLKNIGLTRLIVRDAHPDKWTEHMWEGLGSDANFTEFKAENTIDRLTSAANPRFIERVVEGSRFEFEMVYSVFQMPGEEDFADKTNDDLKRLLMGLRLLEGTAIGKSGSRGYGKIRFRLAEPVWVSAEDYESGSQNWKDSNEALPEEFEGLKYLKDIDTNKFQYA